MSRDPINGTKMTNNNPMGPLFMAINNLLDEICTFLSNEQNLSNSASVRSQTNKILGKLKHQSKAIAQMKDSLVEGDSYVEMKGQSTPANMYVEFGNSKDEIYCDITENAAIDGKNSAETFNSKDTCPYITRRYSDFRTCRHKGVLSKREKLLFFDTNRKYYGLIYENYFLLYLSDTEGHATHALNLHEFQVVDENRKSFFLINKATKIMHIFFAYSKKDKQQWLLAINSKKVIDAKNEKNRYSGSSRVNPLDTESSFKLRESLEPAEIYESLEEEEYEKVDNSPIINSLGKVKAYSKPLPKLPDVSSPPYRPKATKPTPISIRPTSSSDIDENDDIEEADSKTVPSRYLEEDHYDIVCAPRIPKSRLAVSSKSRTADIASVHPSVVSALNRRFNPQVERLQLMKMEPVVPTADMSSTDEYYDSIAGLRESSAIKTGTAMVEEDIYDRVVNTLPKQRMSLQPQTMDELKTRLEKMQQSKTNPVDNIKPDLDNLIKPVVKAEVKVEKIKSSRRRYIF